jgi:3-isopropylmalate/(R)-2-methylmalate dehydratase small subunit
LVAGPDFGTGSSREHAVWALMDYEFRVVISSRFADIFRGNAGLLAAEVAQDGVELLWKLIEQNPGPGNDCESSRSKHHRGNSVGAVHY